jgi:amino acid transporter
VLWVVTLAMWFCGLSCVTSTSRMIFAFARDKGLPMSPVWAGISRRFRTPAAGVWLAAVLAFLLPCLILTLVALFPRRLDFGKVYPAVTGLSTIGLYLSYGIPLLLKLRAIRQGTWSARANGPWTLGNWSVPVNLIALGWIAFITVLFVLPPNHLTGWILAGALTALLILYVTTVRGRFKGPVPQAHSPAELLRIEAELERSKS